MKTKSTSGVTVPSQFRLSAETLAQLDSLVAEFSADRGTAETRTNVIRQLIYGEWKKRAKKSGK
jgi:hypothetical protein